MAMTIAPEDNDPRQIKALRACLGLTQVALAEAAGVSFPTVNRWVNGKVKPSPICWARLRQLEVELDARGAEALAGVRNLDDQRSLDWCAYHLLLLTATRHMGKDYPYQALRRFLEPDVLSTPEVFNEFPAEHRASHCIRRIKEEMVDIDGRPPFPKRISDTLGYEFSQGLISAQTLYDETTDHLRFVSNLLLKHGHTLSPAAQRLAVEAGKMKEQATAFLLERVARQMALERRKRLLDTLPERENFLQRGFDFREAELAVVRARHAEKARGGNRRAIEALEEVKRQQRQLADRRSNALAVLHREPELVAPGPMTFVAHALVVPSSDPRDVEEHDVNVELAAMSIARAFEEAAGAEVLDVHTPELARAAGLPENPGFDLLSIRPGDERRCIEVKGRAGTGDIEVSANEWAKACNMRQDYWLYAVYDCATPSPRLVRVQDPFGSLLARAKGSVLISPARVLEAGEAMR